MQIAKDKVTKAAMIGGIFTIVAAIIGGLFMIFTNKLSDNLAKKGTFTYNLERIDTFGFPEMIFSYDRLQLQNSTDHSISEIKGTLKKGFFPIGLIRIVPHGSVGVNVYCNISSDKSVAEITIDNMNPGESVSFDILVQWRELRFTRYNSLDIVSLRTPNITAIKEGL